MSGLVDSATSVMSASSRRLEIAALNVANASTSGFKRLLRGTDYRGIQFSDALAQIRTDPSPGKILETGRSLDLAINGPGYFQLRSGDRIVYSRQGSFALAADGTVVTPQGYVLQQSGGGDLVLSDSQVQILADGTVIEDDRPVARIATFRPAGKDVARPIDGSVFEMAEAAAEEVSNPSLRQGALEASNVSFGDEMIAGMIAVREAETGAKLIQTYDDLVGRAIQTFGQLR
ncbi:flagellar hook-basal body protein [Sphingomonas sp. DT-204]|uniref:flagellar hook-basal body protein n=1 Tax=Sphingomonas sp. DT-204 TaxID=3396166 RepID=UPI003F1AA9F3